MKTPETSIIIRTKNEQKWIENVLKKLLEQTYQDFEIIVIDSGSKDRTLEIVKKYPFKLLQIPPKDFSYPYALNYAIKRSLAQRYIVMLSAHSIPISNTWLKDGLENFEKYENAMGVFGFLRALPDAKLIEKLTMFVVNIYLNIIQPKRVSVKRKASLGTLGFTNAIIRKDLWDKRQLNEDYGLGGEDGEWADYWMKKGLIAIYDKKFAVHHSHYVGIIDGVKQYFYWLSTSRPQSFRKLMHRHDPTHSD